MLSQKLRECGVVGAGGAGFSTYVKAQAQAEFMNKVVIPSPRPELLTEMI